MGVKICNFKCNYAIIVARRSLIRPEVNQSLTKESRSKMASLVVNQNGHKLMVAPSQKKTAVTHLMQKQALQASQRMTLTLIMFTITLTVTKMMMMMMACTFEIIK